ncbi:hypothetical protein ABZ863_11650 [Saccharomonospora sp. NPDC046836]|uniref:hypothetical protein n=1 Tax=Saccharomonospora sp. NPDC046836 TaxID=3156921 RepID=UPI0033D54C85
MLGLGLRFVGDGSWRGVIAAAGGIGLVWGDVVRRAGFEVLYGPVYTLFAVLVTALLFKIGSQTLAEFTRIGLRPFL